MLQSASVTPPSVPTEDKSRKLKSRLMQKLEKKRQSKSCAIKTMTIEELHEQNERVKRQMDEKTKPIAPPLPHKESPPETAVQFLKNEGTARVFTVPKLTVSHDDSSDDVRLYIEMNIRISVLSREEMNQRQV